MPLTKKQTKEIAKYLAAKILHENRLIVEFDISDPDEEEAIRAEIEAMGERVSNRQGTDIFFIPMACLTVDSFIAFVKQNVEGGSDGSN